MPCPYLCSGSHAPWSGFHRRGFRGGFLRLTTSGDRARDIMKRDFLGWIADSVYQEKGEATLYGEVPYETSRKGSGTRNIEHEEWVI